MPDYAPLPLAETTTSVYQILLDTHILPAIGHLKLSKIQPVHMNKLYKEMSEHRLDGKDGGYSPTTIKRVHALISSILSTAVRSSSGTPQTFSILLRKRLLPFCSSCQTVQKPERSSCSITSSTRLQSSVVCAGESPLPCSGPT